MVLGRKWLRLSASVLALASVGVLAACGNQASKEGSKNIYSYVYVSDPDSLDYITTGRSSTSEITTQGVDGLLENDKYGNYVPSLAKDWKVSADGLTYTYTLRDGINWYTSDGEEYAPVTAEDFVTGLKHAADKNADALFVVQDSIVGLKDYVDGKNKDFGSVGVKALDDKTVQYTLAQPESFWNSKMTYGILAPVNAEFLKSKGDDFGKSTDPSSILYNGPFLLTAMTSKSSLEFVKNPNYWDADNVKLDGVQLTYYDGQDQESLFRNFDDGAYSGARLYPTTPSYKTAEKKYGDSINYSMLDATTYYGTFNLNRETYNHTKKTTDTEKSDTKKAILNKDFRQALTFAFDRTAYSAQSSGEAGAKIPLRNSFVPPTFVQIGEKAFGTAVEENLVTYGDEWQGVDLSDSQDGLYNPEKAKAEFAKAKEALTAEGVSFPIHLDLPQSQSATVNLQQVQSMKQSVEKVLGKDNVVVDIIELPEDTYHSITYFAESAEQNDWDISFASGWGPDYQDPSSYLDIFDVTSTSSHTRVIGIDPGQDTEIASAVGLDEYANLVHEAGKITTDTDARYEAYAKAEAYLADSALFIPTTAKTGTPSVSKVVPFVRSFSWSGLKGVDSYKYVELQDKPVTTKQYEKAKKEWESKKAESNAKYAEELEKHVEK